MKKRSTKVQTDGQVLMDHIRELRTRIIVCAVVLIVGGVVGYLFYNPILEWLRSPLGTNLYYSTPAGSFNFVLKVSSMIGILAAVPFIIFQLIMFVQPVFKEKLSTPRIVFYTVASILLAVAGACFAFYGILPGALKFFAGFQVAGLSALIDANNYLNFVINAIVTFILVFQIPLLMVIIDRIKPISPKKLFAAEKYVVLGGLLVSLIVPFAMDITTCLLIASPIVILYNLSVGMIVIRHFASRHQRVELPVITPLTAEEIALDDQLVTEFFASRTRKLPELTLAPIAESHEISELFLELAPVPAFAQVEAKTAAMERTTETVEPTPIQTVMHKNANVHLDIKPLPGQVNIEQLRAEAKARREQQIAQRVAMYNRTNPLRAINDIR
ncbi:MAG TPA: twin-arginine translocase subunit TatC [Candidatus Microsaccharimonas sp.]